MLAITTTDFGGAETVVRELATRLDRRLFEPIVCSLCPPGRTARMIEASGIPVVSLEMSERPRPTELVAGARRLARLVDAYGVDLVHSFLYRANFLARIAARLSSRRPVAVSGYHSLSPLVASRATIAAARLTRHLSDRVVAVSEAVRDGLIRDEGVMADRIVVIRNGVDSARFRPEEQGPARQALGIPAGAIAVGSAGRLSAEKCYPLLLEAAKALRKQGRDVWVLLAGDGPEHTGLSALAEDLGIAPFVRFLGMLDDVRPLYAALDIFVLTSKEEASPTAVIESMSCGRPVVATNVGGVPEIIEDAVSGVIIEPNSAFALVGALESLIGDPGQRASIAAAARKRVLALFDLDEMVRQHAAFYCDLLRRRDRRTPPSSVV